MLRIIQVGVAGYGATWLRTVPLLPERVEYAALVDVSPDALTRAREVLGTPDLPSFDRLESALAAVEADAVLCVVPPMYHESVIVPAIEAGLHVLTEKPIADSLEACHRILQASRRGRGVTMVSQKGRYHPWVRLFREIVQTNGIGALSHLTYWYKDGRLFWGKFRHELADALFVEMSIHHFDLIRAILGREAVSVWAESWNPPWSGFKGDIIGFARFRFEGGLPVHYHANKISRGDLSSWYGDIVAEGEHATLTLDYPRLFKTRMGASPTFTRGLQEDLLRAGDPQEGQIVSFTEFLDAIDEQRSPETSMEDNLKSMAMMFAAIDSAHSGVERKIADYLI